MALPAYIDAETGAITDGEAWVALVSTTLGSDTASITFTSTDDGQVGDFSQYMDLVVITYGRTATAVAQDNIWMRFNGDTTNGNYAGQYLEGNGSAATANTEAQPIVGILPANSATANIFGSMVSHLFDVNSGKYKSSVHQSACDTDGSGYVWLHAMTWKNQSPITSVQVISKNAGNLKDGTRIDLFGVLPRMVA
jgi:hypothetical protein